MNELNKLIEQYETENPGKKARTQVPFWQGVTLVTSDDFVLWLASRPTCGKEQRLFLDELETNGVLNGFEHCNPKSWVEIRGSQDTVIYHRDFEADIEKVLKGE